MDEKELQEKVYEAIELAKRSGKIKKGTNEVTKVIEKGSAKLVVAAKDVNPAEIVMHLQPLCKEKGIPFAWVAKKDELGTAAGLIVGTSCVAIVVEGDAKKIMTHIEEELKA